MLRNSAMPGSLTPRHKEVADPGIAGPRWGGVTGQPTKPSLISERSMRVTAMALLLAGASAWLLPPVGTPRQRASHPSMSASEKTGRDAAVEKYGEEGMREIRRRGHAAAAAKVGGASAFGQLGRDAAVKKYGEEGMREMSRRGHAAAAAKFGGASALSQLARDAALEKYGKEGMREISRRGHATAAANAGGHSALSQLGRDAAVEKYGEEGMREMSRQGLAAAVAKHPRGKAGHAMGAGLAAARAAGKYTRYPGVRCRKDTKKWRVQFASGGRKNISIGQYATEDEAARAHDDYVREHGLDRPLHFPRPGEWRPAVTLSSVAASPQPLSFNLSCVLSRSH